MAVSPFKLLELFSEFAGLAPHFAKRFAYKHPELVEPPDPEAPPEAPSGDLDPEIEVLINDGEL